MKKNKINRFSRPVVAEDKPKEKDESEDTTFFKVCSKKLARFY